MKPEILLFTSITLIVFLLCSPSVNAQTDEYNYSIKNRWTVKASYSRYKTAYNYEVAYVGDFFVNSLNRKMTNFKVEANYGINKFIEVGAYTGFQHYEWAGFTGEILDGDFRVFELKEGFAPLFGAQINFHILPFLVRSEKCRWDLYLTAKYGGCYLPHREWDDEYNTDSKYRQEYGLGMGAGYYFKNIVGIFAEASVGQYSFFKNDPVVRVVNDVYTNVITTAGESNFRFRIGIAAKINK